MTASTQKPGPDSSSPSILTESERFAINKICQDLLAAWDRGELGCDGTDLLIMLNAAAARATRMVREAGLSGVPNTVA